MEEVLIVLLQGLFELILQILLYFPLDWPYSARCDRESGIVIWCLVLLLLGMGFGGIFNVIHPKVMIPFQSLRIINLIICPFINGFVSGEIASWRSGKYGSDVGYGRHFLYGFLFSLGFVVIRFTYASR